MSLHNSSMPNPSEPDFEAMWSGYEQHIQQLKTADEQSMEIFPEPGLVVKTRLWFRTDPQYGAPTDTPDSLERKRAPVRTAYALAQAGAEAAAEQKDSGVIGRAAAEGVDKMAAAEDDSKPVKVFLNLCQSKHIAPPAECADPNDGQTKLRVPLSCGQPMPDTDKEGGACVVFDVVFNPQAIQQCLGDNDSELKQTIIAFTVDNIQRKHAITLDPEIKFPKLRYKGAGAPPSQRIRKTNVHISAPAIQEVAAPQPTLSSGTSPSEPPLPTVPPVVTPNHQLYCVSATGGQKVTLQDYEKQFLAKAKKDGGDGSAEIPLPKTLLLEIDLPLAKSTAELDVTISPTDLLLRGASSSTGAPSLPYALHLLFPFKVNDSAVVSKFSKAHQKLLLQLPVVGVVSDESDNNDIDAENVTDFRAALGFRNKLMYQLAT